MRKFVTKNCLATKPRKSILDVIAVLVGILADLVGVLAFLVGALGVLCIGMVYLLHEIEHSELRLVYTFGIFIKKNVNFSWLPICHC